MPRPWPNSCAILTLGICELPLTCEANQVRQVYCGVLGQGGGSYQYYYLSGSLVEVDIDSSCVGGPCAGHTDPPIVCADPQSFYSCPEVDAGAAGTSGSPGQGGTMGAAGQGGMSGTSGTGGMG